MFFRKGKKNKKKLGLALGGGNARGLAHIGVIKVFEKEEIPIDMIAGTSIGAVIGGMYAASRDIKDIERVALATDKNKIFEFLYDPSVAGGLIKGDKIENFIREYLDDLKFSDLRMPFRAVATNLSTGMKEVLYKGDLTDAIRASISIPLVFEPVERNGHLLVDGGLAEPVPAATVKDMGAGIVAAVNLDSVYSIKHQDWHDLNIKKVLEGSMNITRIHLAQKCLEDADIAIEPKFSHVGLMSWEAYYSMAKDMIKIGEDAAYDCLRKVKSLL